MLAGSGAWQQQTGSASGHPNIARHALHVVRVTTLERSDYDPMSMGL